MRLTTDAAGDNGQGFEAAYQAICAAGYTWDIVSQACTPCPAGSHSSVAGASSCVPCAVGFFAQLPGATQCTQCPAFSSTSAAGTHQQQMCVCQSGYYGWNNECRICSEGASCPGGNVVSARPGWCETTNSTMAVPSFSHCCQPSMCQGGQNAFCDASVGLVGEAACSVQQISWDSLHLVSLTTGTWVTFVMIMVLGLLICFCTGLSLGVRRGARRQIDSLVVPVPAQLPPPAAPPPAPKPYDRTPVESMSAGAMVQAPGALEMAPPPMLMPPPPEPRLPTPHQQTEYASMFARAPAYDMQAAAAQRGGDEEVMEISLDEADSLGAGAPPPQLAATFAPFGGGRGGAMDDGGEEESVAYDEEGEEVPKKKKGKKGKKASSEEGEEEAEEEAEGDEDEDGKKKKKKKDGDNKKKKKGKGDDGEGGDGEEESAGGSEKKKKKKKKADE